MKEGISSKVVGCIFVNIVFFFFQSLDDLLCLSWLHQMDNTVGNRYWCFCLWTWTPHISSLFYMDNKNRKSIILSYLYTLILSNYTYYKSALGIFLLLPCFSSIHPSEFRIYSYLITEWFIHRSIQTFVILAFIYLFSF